MPVETDEVARVRALDAAEQLFYGHGVQAVGMDAVRTASGLPLKRLYRLFPSKGELVEAYLRRRDTRWRADLAAYVATATTDPEERLLAVFDWLRQWFEEPGFRGCAFVNAYGELGADSPAVAAAARHHKAEFGHYLAGLTGAARLPAPLAGHLLLLAEGAITTAAVTGGPAPADGAREAAAVLLAAAGGRAAHS
ncbi:TetR family transcriptional regulator [Kitasatospora sp. NE20-6]